jgi:hypothetical protein
MREILINCKKFILLLSYYSVFIALVSDSSGLVNNKILGTVDLLPYINGSFISWQPGLISTRGTKATLQVRWWLLLMNNFKKNYEKIIPILVFAMSYLSFTVKPVIVRILWCCINWTKNLRPKNPEKYNAILLVTNQGSLFTFEAMMNFDKYNKKSSQRLMCFSTDLPFIFW